MLVVLACYHVLADNSKLEGKHHAPILLEHPIRQLPVILEPAVVHHQGAVVGPTQACEGFHHGTSVLGFSACYEVKVACLEQVLEVAHSDGTHGVTDKVDFQG